MADLIDGVVEEEGESDAEIVKSVSNPNMQILITVTNDANTQSEPKLWVDVIRGNRQTSNGKAVPFVAPMVMNGVKEVEIELEDVEAEIQYWDNALIMYAIGGNLSMHAVKNYMRKMWSFMQIPQMFYNEEGYFIMKFKSDEDRDEVMMKGLYTIHDMPMVILEWRPDVVP